MKNLVITADDFGIASAVNAAVEVAHREGVLTSASVMANMPAFGDAVAVAGRNPRLGVGVHCTLTSGRPVSPPHTVPLLVDTAGHFRHGYVALSRLVLGPNRAVALDQIALELSAQVEKAVAAGLEIDHLDGHRHVQMIPGIWQVVQRIAAEYGGIVVRNSRERPHWEGVQRAPISNLLKTAVLHACAGANQAPARTPVRIAGVMDSGCVNVRALARVLRRLPESVSEIVTHPSLPIVSPTDKLCCASADERFVRSQGRLSEFRALIHPKVRRLIEDHQVELVTFRRINAAAPSPASGAVAC